MTYGGGVSSVSGDIFVGGVVVTSYDGKFFLVSFVGLAGGGATLDIRQEPHQPITQDGVWSDFLCTQLHPKSLCVLSGG